MEVYCLSLQCLPDYFIEPKPILSKEQKMRQINIFGFTKFNINKIY